MKFALNILSFLLTLLIHVTVLGQHKALNIETGMSKNCISLDKVSTENTYNNRRQIMTSCSIEDFNIRLSPYDLTCAEILVGHFHCDICFNQIENSLTSYDGSKFYFTSNLPGEITKECLSLISNMRMGALEHNKFLELLTREQTD
jgi:hypothetical protein